ncbi:MAG TPA: hypothetical protein VF050_01260 [Moraxellaceae bacterium]
MTPEQLAYIERRRRQIRYWPFVAATLLALLIACYALLWFKYPLFVSPGALATHLLAGQPDLDQLALMAVMGNLAFIGCGLFIAALIGVASLALYNEHRLIRLLEPHFPPQTPPPGDEPPAGHA